MKTTEKDSTPKRGLNAGHLVALVYSIFALATLSFVVFAFTQKVDVVSDDYYSKAVDYDRHITRVNSSNELATGVEFQLSSDNKSLVLSFPRNVMNTSVKGEVVLYRPSVSGIDKNIPIKLSSDNTQRIDVTELMKGKWIAKVTWSSSLGEYYDEYVLQL
jgi:hypothetical protein